MQHQIKYLLRRYGDVYNVLTTGANYVWTDTGWDKLSETIDLSAYLTKAEAGNTYATIVALNDYVKKEDFDALVDRVEALESQNGGGNV